GTAGRGTADEVTAVLVAIPRGDLGEPLPDPLLVAGLIAVGDHNREKLADTNRLRAWNIGIGNDRVADLGQQRDLGWRERRGLYRTDRGRGNPRPDDGSAD